MFSSIDMTQLTPEKTGFSKVKEYIFTSYADWLNLCVFLGYRMRIKIISGLVLFYIEFCYMEFCSMSLNTPFMFLQKIH